MVKQPCREEKSQPDYFKMSLVLPIPHEGLRQIYQLTEDNGVSLILYPRVIKQADNELLNRHRVARRAPDLKVFKALDSESRRKHEAELREGLLLDIQLKQKGPEAEQQAVYGCELRRVNISFDDLGWGDNIVYPRHVEANYCIGNCQHPPGGYADVRMTNHAFVRSTFIKRAKQGLIKHWPGKQSSSMMGSPQDPSFHKDGELMTGPNPSEVNMTPGSPSREATLPEGLAPCCVPMKLAPISLLYRVNETIYLAELQEMKAEVCGCL